MERRDKLALVSEEASEWFIRLKDDGLALDEQDEYLKWLKASPEHIAEALRMGRLFARLRRTGLEGEVTDEEISNVVEFASREERCPTVSDTASGWRSWGIAATAAIMMIGVLLVVGSQLGWLGGAIETDASEWRRFTLSDGSTVRAGPRTRLEIQFSDKQRVIQLPDGEALFQVAKDPNRPFFVNAGGAMVRAVGTEFGVSRKDGKIFVTVAEGKVAVSQLPSHTAWFRSHEGVDEGGGGKGDVAVSAGQQAAVPSAGPVTVHRVNVSNELAWAQGRLIFESGTTIAQAIGEFNRRNHVQIIVKDSVIANQPIRGVFDAADPESFAEVIARGVNASVVRDTPGVLFLQPRNEAHDDASDSSGEALPPISAGAQPLDEPPTGPSVTRMSEAL